MFDYQPHLTGDVVALRPTAIDDFEALYSLASDSEVWALHPQHNRWKPDIFRAYFNDGLASGGALTAINRANGAVVGWSRYSSMYTQPGEIEIGWTFLGRAYWGGACNGDMKRIMLIHAFKFVDTVIFRVGDTNLRSRRAVEKLGARLTERRETVQAPNGHSINLYYALPRAVFGA